MTVLVVRGVGSAVLLPVEERVDDDRLHHMRCGVIGVAGVVVVERVGVGRRRPIHRTLDGFGVRIDEQLARIAAPTRGWVIGAVDAVPVALTRPDAGQVAVPDEGISLTQRDRGLVSGRIEQAEFDSLGNIREQREVRSCAVVRGAKRIRSAGPDLHRAPSGVPTCRAISRYDARTRHDDARSGGSSYRAEPDAVRPRYRKRVRSRGRRRQVRRSDLVLR